MGQKGALRNHGHSSTSGDGGQITNLVITGTMTAAAATASTNLPTLAQSMTITQALAGARGAN